MEILDILKEILVFLKEVWDRINKKITIFYIVIIIIGATNIFGIYKLPLHKSWIILSLFFTLVYTIIYHVCGLKNGYFEGIGKIKGSLVVIIDAFLLLINFIITNELHGILTKTPQRDTILGLITLCFFTYSFTNWIIYKHFLVKIPKETNSYKKDIFQRMSNDFKHYVFTSDLPITVTFLILLLYSLSLNSIISFIYTDALVKKEIINGFEYFFSGAIAFQIMYSNAIWIFTDNQFFKKLTKG